MQTNEATQLPDSVPVGGNRAWRPASGKIVRGREQDGTLEERDAILGYLRRITVFYGKLETGEDYGKLECELQTRNGHEVFATNLLNPTNGKPTLSSSVSLAHALLDSADGELLQINVGQSKTANKYGTFSTYVNVTGIDPVTLKPRGRKGERDREDGVIWDGAYLNELTDKLELHPAYAQREQKSEESSVQPAAPVRTAVPTVDEFDPFADE